MVLLAHAVVFFMHLRVCFLVTSAEKVTKLFFTVFIVYVLMKYYRIKKSDIEECSSLFAKVFSGPPWSEPWTEALAFKRLSHFYESLGFLGVAAKEKTIIGFALGNSEPFCFGSIFYLREMCVDSDLHRKGIGSVLMDTLHSELEQCKVDSLYLATKRMTPAADFYQHKGFTYSEEMGFYTKKLSL